MSGLVAAFDKGGTGGDFTRGGRPAWSTALRSGRSPYRFAGSNPAPRITVHKAGENHVHSSGQRVRILPPASPCIKQVRTMFTPVDNG